MAEIAGLKLIVPSSVAGSGVSVSASGKVTFTAATSVSVNGCFSSTYDNYLVVTSWIPSTSAHLQARLRASGVDASGSNYTLQSIYADGTSVSAGRVSSTTNAVIVYSASTTCNGAHAYFYGPALAQPTASRSVTVHSASGASLNDIAYTHSLSTAYDGFTLFPNSGNITGSLCVYGLAQ